MNGRTTESTTPLRDAGRLFPSPPPSYRTLLRWVRTGFRGTILKAVRYGNSWHTTAAWVREFRDACTAKSMPDRQPNAAVVDDETRRAIEYLKKNGIDLDG